MTTRPWLGTWERKAPNPQQHFLALLLALKKSEETVYRFWSVEARFVEGTFYNTTTISTSNHTHTLLTRLLRIT